MIEPQTYDIYYDKESDFLEVFFGAPSASLGEEIADDIFVRRDVKTNEVKSIGIFSFKKRPYVLKEILKKLKLSLPLNISV